jgi:ribosomal protein S18 acetylase RimI-like enzyme
VRTDDTAALAATVARAFYGNPSMGWIFRDDSRRLERLERGFALYLERLWLGRGDLYTTDRRAGLAVWMPPGEWHVPVSLQLRVLPAIARSARGDLLRLLSAFQLIERKHPRERHWYLLLLGVEPELHGRGFGSHLMQPVLRRCDGEGLPAYLETDTERNVALYERHGFEVTERFELPRHGPPIWLMWREAAARGEP